MAQRPQVTSVHLDGRDIPLQVVRSARRRRTIAIGVDSGVVVVRAPMRTTQAEVARMVESRRSWILQRLDSAALQPRRTFEDGETLPYLGREMRLRVVPVAGRRSRAAVEGDELVVHVPEAMDAEARREKARRILAAWYRDRAAELFGEFARHWSSESGLVPRALMVRDQKSRWGSCGPDGTIRLNWRLVLGAPDLAEYVVVHEIAHLRHRNHQQAFWQEVARMLPDFQSRRKRLREAGAGFVL
ncbi:SprT family zinc-dependent metalloprotease [Candidatus Amarobacter glycogenicus]|uniref:M48 family metallopeptidase n=1 Tax=Candidatus Amarobacter glycogenicus TaxID=3140699 RepID=UPI00313559CA|nr:M48 family metallopeptidase [Dehalococcoidia bacterium]